MKNLVNHLDGEGSSDQDHKIGIVPKVEVLDLESSVKPIHVESAEESLACSSSSHLKSHFIGMGFAPTLVEKVIEEHGEEDVDLLLETLFTYSALQNSSPEPSNFPDDVVNPIKDENDSSFEFSMDDSQDYEEFGEASKVDKDRKDALLMMNFSEDEVDLAIKRLGEDASVTELVEFIVVAQAARSSGEKAADFATEDVKVFPDAVQVITTETLFGTRDKTLRLLEMGFSGDEVSSAIDRFGADVPVLELADSIFAYRIANKWVEDDEDTSGFIRKIPSTNENDSRDLGSSTAEHMKHCSPENKMEETQTSSSNDVLYIKNKDFRTEKGKQTKWISELDKFASLCIPKRVKLETGGYPMSSHYRQHRESAGAGSLKPEDLPMSNPSRNLHQLVAKPPFFFYGNMVNISRETWAKVSQFLYGIEPEFVNSQFFSALIRKEGYVHNLPTEDRVYIHPRPPMTIEDALPHTRKWWPSWDTRKQLSCIRSETTGITQICERLGRMLTNSQGVLSKEQQTDLLHQCKTMNLIWVGLYKLSPIEPQQVESILGYPQGHTQICGLTPVERLRLLKYNFQTDTLGYYLSPLKNFFPNGLTVLSLFSGIGGAQVALHRLGFHLKCVVSVDDSTVNREIQKKWWSDTRQTGVLRLFDDIQKLASSKLEGLIVEFGGFDIVIAGNPSSHVCGNPKIATDGENPEGVDFMLFYEFVRVFQRVRSIMGTSR